MQVVRCTALCCREHVRVAHARLDPRFEVFGVTPDLCQATLKTVPDNVLYHPLVVINPSKT